MKPGSMQSASIWNPRQVAARERQRLQPIGQEP